MRSSENRTGLKHSRWFSDTRLEGNLRSELTAGSLKMDSFGVSPVWNIFALYLPQYPSGHF